MEAVHTHVLYNLNTQNNIRWINTQFQYLNFTLLKCVPKKPNRNWTLISCDATSTQLDKCEYSTILISRYPPNLLHFGAWVGRTVEPHEKRSIVKWFNHQTSSARNGLKCVFLFSRGTLSDCTQVP